MRTLNTKNRKKLEKESWWRCALVFSDHHNYEGLNKKSSSHNPCKWNTALDRAFALCLILAFSPDSAISAKLNGVDHLCLIKFPFKPS